MNITIAWIGLDGEDLLDELECYDGVHWRRKRIMCVKSHAVNWATVPRPGSMERARAFVARDLSDKPFVRIYQFPPEEDFLTLAKEQVMRDWTSQ